MNFQINMQPREITLIKYIIPNTITNTMENLTKNGGLDY